MKPRVLIWLTRDLRVSDNVLWEWAELHSQAALVLGFVPQNKTENQKRFYAQSAIELGIQLKEKGVGFFLLEGAPDTEIPKWVALNAIEKVLVQDSFNSRDGSVIQKLRTFLGEHAVKTFTQQTLLDLEDLPFQLQELPMVYTEFRKKIEKSVSIKPPKTGGFSRLSGFDVKVPRDAIDVLRRYSSVEHAYPFGILPGESGAFKRIQEYFWDSRSLLNYQSTRNGMLNVNDSSKLSPALSLGCISARTIYSELKKFEQKFEKNSSTIWFFYELLWRDYFKFLALKLGDRLFHRDGIRKEIRQWSNDPIEFERWCSGQTVSDFVNSNMNELNRTGWMSNRGRQNVASYLSKTMKMDWTMGAKYFESHLLDDDTENNWGNWLYLAGVGTDPRDRIFNVDLQAETYDSDRSYRKKWL